MTTGETVTAILGAIIPLLLALVYALVSKNKADVRIRSLTRENAKLAAELAKEKERAKDELQRVAEYHEREKKRCEDEVRRLYDLGIRAKAVGGTLSDAQYEAMKRAQLFEELRRPPESS